MDPDHAHAAPGHPRRRRRRRRDLRRSSWARTSSRAAASSSATPATSASSTSDARELARDRCRKRHLRSGTDPREREPSGAKPEQHEGTPMTEQPPGRDRPHGADRPQHRDAAVVHRVRHGVIVSRALPDVRDGLKPVHRRVVYAMYDGGYRPDRGYNKCARVVGEVMGAVPPARRRVDLRRPGAPRAGLVAALPAGRRARATSARPGNDGAAAPRYTECRMAPLAMEMVRDIDQETVDFNPNYDGKTQRAGRAAEPVPEPAGQRLRRHRRRHGHPDPAAQPARGRRRRRSGTSQHPEANREELLEALMRRSSRARTSRPAR